MFEQLEDDDFYRMYSKRENGISHRDVDLAILPLSTIFIEMNTRLVFSHRENDGYYQAVVGFDGRESFVLSCDNPHQKNSQVCVKCSSLMTTKQQRDIVSYVIRELDIGIKECVWLRKSMLVGDI